MVKITEPMLAEAVEEVIQSIAPTHPLKYDEIAHYLTAQLDPDSLSYETFINGQGYAAEDLPQLLRIIKEHALTEPPSNAPIHICIHNEDYDEIGTMQCSYYRNPDMIGATNKIYGACIGLDHKLNELLRQDKQEPKMYDTWAEAEEAMNRGESVRVRMTAQEINPKLVDMAHDLQQKEKFQQWQKMSQDMSTTECPTCEGTGETPARSYLHEKIGKMLHGLAYVAKDALPEYTKFTTGLAGRAPDRIIGHDELDRHTAIKKVIIAAGLDPDKWGVCPDCSGDGFKKVKK